MEQLLRNSRLLLVLGIGLFTLSGSAFWWTGVYTPRLTETESLEADLDRLKDSNRATRQSMARMDVATTRRAIAGYEQQTSALMGLVPADTAVQPLTVAAPGLGAGYDVTVSDVRPLQPRTVDGFVSDGVNLKVRGRYHDVGAYLAALLSMNRVTHIRDARLTVVAPSGGGRATEISPGVFHVEASLTLHGFLTPARDAPRTASTEGVAPPSERRPRANNRNREPQRSVQSEGRAP
jgi:Tfp pilus assembly protein PilO